MANIGAGETLRAWLVKKEKITDIESFLYEKDNAANFTKTISKYGQFFRYRTLTTSEMTFQPLSNHLKGKYDLTLFTSELDINPKERDIIYFEDGTKLNVKRVLPQKQLGMYMFAKRFPVILELE